MYWIPLMGDRKETKMKKCLIGAVLIMVIVPFSVLGCQTAENNINSSSSVPPLHGGQPAVTVEFTIDEFAAQNHIGKYVEQTVPGSIIVTLGANPTTGYQWGENPIVSDPTLIEWESHNYVTPETSGGTVGAPGKDVWVFNSLKPGQTTISFSYGRPWEGGEKDAWTLVLNVTVK